MEKQKVIIIGGGFGGLNAAKELANTQFQVRVIDRTNHHLFQPLLYQVATAALSPGDIAVPIRTIFKKYKNIDSTLGNVVKIDKAAKKVMLENGETYSFDYLIISIGSRHSYFGKNEWEEYAPGLKTLKDALSIREKILLSLEEADKLLCTPEAEKYITFVIVGGGPTGVELAGALAEILPRNVKAEFRHIDSKKIKIYLIEGLKKLLAPYPDELALKAKEDLESMGVKVLLEKMVTKITDEGVHMGEEYISTKNIIWAAGNSVSSLLNDLQAPMDKAGRVEVKEDLSIPGESNIFVIGDASSLKDANGNMIPGIAPAAIQQGKYVGRKIKMSFKGIMIEPFRYNDKGIMATIGRAKAVAKVNNLKLSGLIAWLLWTFIHIFFLIGFRNRIRVMSEWIWFYFTFRPGIRLIINRNDIV